MSDEKLVFESPDDVLGFFEDRLDRYGNSSESLELSRTSQLARFKVLSEVGDLSDGKRVLDLGCGLGHLYEFLAAQYPNVQYTGWDLSPRLIEMARTSYPAARFDVHDVLSDGIPEMYDYVVSSGLFGLESGSNWRQMCEMTLQAFNSAKLGVAVNMLSCWATQKKKGRHFYDPVIFLSYASSLTPKLILRHDYLPHDFTVYLYHPSWGPK